MNQITESSKIILNFCKLRVIKFFWLKDQITDEPTSSIVFKLQCHLYHETSYGETRRHLVVRSGKHIGFSHLTNEKVKSL